MLSSSCHNPKMILFSIAIGFVLTAFQFSLPAEASSFNCMQKRMATGKCYGPHLDHAEIRAAKRARHCTKALLARRCAANPKCGGYAFIPPGKPGSGKCNVHLYKKAYGTCNLRRYSRNQHNWNSCQKTGAQKQCYKAYDALPNDWGKWTPHGGLAKATVFANKTTAWCKALCTKRADCVAFTIELVGGKRCFLGKTKSFKLHAPKNRNKMKVYVSSCK